MSGEGAAMCKYVDIGSDTVRKTRLETFASFPLEVDGLAGGLPPKVRNALLRMVGNGWSYPVALMFYRWLAAEFEKPLIENTH
jgi:hypothetical protein